MGLVGEVLLLVFVCGVFSIFAFEMYFFIQGIIIVTDNTGAVTAPWQLWVCVLVNVIFTYLECNNTQIKSYEAVGEDKRKKYSCVTVETTTHSTKVLVRGKNHLISCLYFGVKFWLVMINLKIESEHKEMYKNEHPSLWNYVHMYATFIQTLFIIFFCGIACVLLINLFNICCGNNNRY